MRLFVIFTIITITNALTYNDCGFCNYQTCVINTTADKSNIDNIIKCICYGRTCGTYCTKRIISSSTALADSENGFVLNPLNALGIFASIVFTFVISVAFVIFCHSSWVTHRIMKQKLDIRHILLRTYHIIRCHHTDYDISQRNDYERIMWHVEMLLVLDVIGITLVGIYVGLLIAYRNSIKSSEINCF